MRRSALIVAAIVLAASVGTLAAAAALHDRADAASTKRQPASQHDLEATLGYLADCDPWALSPEGGRAYRVLERVVADGLTVDETDAAFHARRVLMDELSCWPKGRPRYPDLGDDYGHPPR